jgi:hypothetical protein
MAEQLGGRRGRLCLLIIIYDVYIFGHATVIGLKSIRHRHFHFYMTKNTP